MRRVWIGTIVGGVALLAAAAGCDHPKARAKLARRQQNLRDTAALAWGLEAGRDKKLAETLKLARDNEARRPGDLAATKTLIDNRIRFECERFEQMQPTYESWFRDMIDRDPAGAAAAFAEMLY